VDTASSTGRIFSNTHYPEIVIKLWIHRYESIAWIPNVVVFITMLGVGYPQLRDNQSAPVSPATPAEVISFASILASSILSWCTMTPDYGVYHSPAASS
jgi:purine-cytosine permease-like protein